MLVLQENETNDICKSRTFSPFWVRPPRTTQKPFLEVAMQLCFSLHRSGATCSVTAGDAHPGPGCMNLRGPSPGQDRSRRKMSTGSGVRDRHKWVKYQDTVHKIMRQRSSTLIREVAFHLAKRSCLPVCSNRKYTVLLVARQFS